jgi:predicted TIM-barrel fold metal-dependent hydrolase
VRTTRSLAKSGRARGRARREDRGAPNTARRRAPRVIDAHGHVNWLGYDAARLVANMDAHGIDVMWLLTWEAPAHEIDPNNYDVFWPNRCGMPLEDVLEAVRQYPRRFVPFYAPDPRQPGALSRLRAAVKQYGVRGCGEMKCRIMLDDPHALEMWHFCGENRLPVIIHMDVPLPRRRLGRDPGYWYCCDWENLARALERCPRTTFIGHAPGFWREISGNADSSAAAYPEGPVTPGGRLWQYLDRYPDLYCDLSANSALRALGRDRECARRFLLRYQDRCLFGRDYFDDALWKFLRSLRLPDAVQKKIVRGNALRLVPR